MGQIWGKSQTKIYKIERIEHNSAWTSIDGARFIIFKTVIKY